MIRLIDITQEDIDNGVPSDCNRCAIALALKREYKTDEVEVSVPDDYVSLCVGKNELNIRYENDVLNFIDCYDYKGDEDDYYHPPPKPFALEVVE